MIYVYGITVSVICYKTDRTRVKWAVSTIFGLVVKYGCNLKGVPEAKAAFDA